MLESPNSVMNRFRGSGGSCLGSTVGPGFWVLGPRSDRHQLVCGFGVRRLGFRV